jgi:hypothetical protein
MHAALSPSAEQDNGAGFVATLRCELAATEVECTLIVLGSLPRATKHCRHHPQRMQGLVSIELFTGSHSWVKADGHSIPFTRRLLVVASMSATAISMAP